MKKNPSLLLLLAALGSASCYISVRVPSDEFDGAPMSRSLAAGGSTTSTGPELASALDQIQASKLASDLAFIASDDLAGRDSPSPGLRIAARYVRARLERLGWQPGARDGYFHEYTLERMQVSREASQLLAVKGDESLELSPGEDYFFWPRPGEKTAVEGDLVFGGDFEDGDAEGLDLEGKWLLVHENGRRWWGLRGRAQKAGALGLLIVPGTPPAPEEGEEAPEPADYAATYGEMLDGARFRSSSSRPSFPMVFVTAEAGQRLLAFAGSEAPELGADLGVRVTDTRAYTVVEPLELENVVGYWPGTSLAQEAIVVSAHYDHVGTNDEGEIYNGADDNGSGTVGLMALAEALAAHGPLERSVVLLWVSAEEKGLLGSRAWTEDPWLPDDARVVANINIDMIGRNAPDELLVTPTSEHEAYGELTRVAEAHAALEGFPELGSADAYWNRSDHANFSRNLEVPVAFLFSDVHEDYHKPTDTVEKIDYDKMRRVVRVVFRMLVDLADGPLES